MINRLTADRIIIPSNKRMEEVINWYKENLDVLDKQKFPTPFNSGVIDFVEENIELSFEVKDDIIEMTIYPKRIEDLKKEHNAKDVAILAKRPVCTFSFKPDTDFIDNIRFAELRTDARLALMFITAKDDTINKCCFKFKALMFYTTIFKKFVIKSNKITKVLAKKHKRLKKKKPQKLIQTTYTLADMPVVESDSSIRLKRAYTLPQTEVKVRGHYRHYKSGKTVWIKPSVKYKDKEHIRKEYEL